MKHLIFKDRVFANHKELYHALKDNEQTIIDLKKNRVYKSIDKGQGIYNVPNILMKTNALKSIETESGFIYPIINSTHWFDSHEDVHLKGCYKNTVERQQGKVYYVDTHQKGLAPIITKRKHIEMFISEVEWKLLNKNIEGTTECLAFKIAEDNVKADYLELIKEDSDLQNSLSMRYVDIAMAVNSTDSAFKENKEMYDEIIGTIANKEDVSKNGIFFAVKELAIMGEGSLCPVIGGSNSATSVITVSGEAQKTTTESQEEVKKGLVFIKLKQNV
jgi:hypothetical protein